MLFKDVVGHSATKEILIQSAQKERVSHAQMIVGNEGSGNFQLALAYAQYVNCEAPDDTDSCGSCSNCVKFQNFQHPDLHFFYPTASNKVVTEKASSKQYGRIWIDFLKEYPYFDLGLWTEYTEIDQKQTIINKYDSEDIIKSLSLKNFDAKYKIILIWWPEKMNIECSNKILKALEEPTPNTLFLLVGYQPDDLLPTILSRVQMIKLPPLSDKEIATALEERKGVPADLAFTLAQLSNGSYSEALQLVKHPEGDEYLIEMFQTFMRVCYKLEIFALNQWIEEMAVLGREKQKMFLEYALRQFRACIIYNYSSEEIHSLHPKEEVFTKNFSKFVHGGNVLLLIEIFEHTHTSIMRNANPKVALMNMSLKVCNYIRLKP